MEDITNLVSDDGSNAKILECQRCPCKILEKNKGKFCDDQQKELHVMHKKLEDAGIVKENLNQFYVVDDMFEFENIGFTKSVDNDTIKYLICADCEVGPLGWHCISSKTNFVALARVKHV